MNKAQEENSDTESEKEKEKVRRIQEEYLEACQPKTTPAVDESIRGTLDDPSVWVISGMNQLQIEEEEEPKTRLEIIQAREADRILDGLEESGIPRTVSPTLNTSDRLFCVLLHGIF